MKRFSRIFLFLFAICLLHYPLELKALAATSEKQSVLQFTNDRKYVYAGDSCTFKVSKAGSGDYSKAVKWKSSNKKKAVVDKNGKVKALKAGKVTITAYSKKNSAIKVSCELNIKNFQSGNVSFKNKTIKETSDILALLKLKSKKIKTYGELQDFIVKANKAYKPNGNFKNTSLYKSLSKYKKSYFKKKSLVLMSDMLSSSSQKIKVAKLRVVKNKGRNASGELYISYGKQGSDEVWLTDIAYAHIVLELNKENVDLIDTFKLVRTGER